MVLRVSFSSFSSFFSTGVCCEEVEVFLDRDTKSPFVSNKLEIRDSKGNESLYSGTEVCAVFF